MSGNRGTRNLIGRVVSRLFLVLHDPTPRSETVVAIGRFRVRINCFVLSSVLVVCVSVCVSTRQVVLRGNTKEKTGLSMGFNQTSRERAREICIEGLNRRVLGTPGTPEFNRFQT